MKIQFIEVQNFRKLKSVRIDFADKTTVFVGANNSGKTSAMVALNHFLITKNQFTTNDFTLSNWTKINAIGRRWEATGLLDDWETAEMAEWESALPSIDIWLNVQANEIYHVIHLWPSVEWAGGLLGVRLRFQPKNIQDFYREFITARREATQTLQQAHTLRNPEGSEQQHTYSVALWPKDMCEFLEKRLNALFTIEAYNLDPTQNLDPENGIARPQRLPDESFPIEGDPFKNLIRIDKIDAHRGFSNLSAKVVDAEGNEIAYGEKGKLSEQLRSYYKKHIDPSTMPDPTDVDALDAIHKAQVQFDEKLKTGFKSRFEELEGLGYPGVTDPRLELSTKLKPVDGLNHSSALKYTVSSVTQEELNVSISLPEHYNGLGYQNLISMVFRLMSFRDDWMQVGKAGKQASAQSSNDKPIHPLHLVLVEEPEAHLHVQVQQVFIRKAYEILRKHDQLGDSKLLSTQLIVSTHSSHIAHECEFSSLRYFRRKPASQNGDVPVSTVVNLSEVFGVDDNTPRFVSRYIKATHCDLFFADGAILVEGPAERMLVPHFIREHFPELHQSYITLLEIGGSHAHRFKSLIEYLGLTTLIITDLDAASHEGRHPSVQPAAGQEQITGNSTLKSWTPQKTLIDELLTLTEQQKETQTDPLFSIKVAYQIPVNVKLTEEAEAESAIPSTFEDAFVLENLEILPEIEGDGLVEIFKNTITASTTVAQLTTGLYDAIRDNNKKKAEFALNVLFYESPDKLNTPLYIKQGLSWLTEKIKIKQVDALAIVVTPAQPDTEQPTAE